MLTIRLTRKGKKNQPFFRVVVIEKKRSSKGGRALEDLGYVNPLTKKRSFKAERIKHWISKGAQPSATIHNMLVSEKIIDAKKIAISNISKKKKAEIAAKAAAEKAAAAAPAVKPAEAPVEAQKDLPAAPVEEVKPVEEAKPEETPAQ